MIDRNSKNKMLSTLKLFTVIFFVLIHCTGFCQPAAYKEKDIPVLPALQWKFAVAAPIFSSPVADDNAVYFGSLDSCFYAVNIQTGKMLWKFTTKGEIRSTALLANELIYFISGDGKLYCLNDSGKEVWAFAEGAERKYDFADYHQSSPILNEGTLFFGMGDGFLYAIDANKGKLIWKIKTDGPIHNTPVIDNGIIYFGSFDGNVYAVDIAKRSITWKFKTVGHTYFPKGEVQGNPSIMNNAVIIGARDYNVYALDKEKGFAHWNKAFTRGWVLSNMYKDSVLYLAGADERLLAAIDGKTMKENWKRNMELLMFGRPAFTKNMLYMGTTIGKLHGIDINTGQDKWVFTTDGYKQNHNKYFKEDDSYRDDIFSIITTNEQFLDAQTVLGGIFSTPLVHLGNIFFTSTEGVLYCLKNIE